MANDILVCVADTALRDVLGLGLAMDGHRVWPAADEDAARRVLAARRPDLLLLDGTMHLSLPAVPWVDSYAPQIPAVVLVPRYPPTLQPARPEVGLLIMPFGRTELLRCITAVQAAHARLHPPSG